ncbi:MAG TPA: HAD-IB family hydrolase [Acidimicrobiales bacterium]|nr:HAD-IB family hydrolase [Acidimicrobiales bacterium]
MSSTDSDVVAAFDLDGTLTKGGSVFKWLCAVAGRGDAYRAALSLALPLAVGAIRSGRHADQAKERLFRRLLAGRTLEELDEKSRRFAIEHLATHGRELVLERLRWHQAQGHDVVIVSASPQLYVDVIAKQLAVRAGIGTRLAVDARGQLTGGYLGRNCRGSEKFRRLREWIEARGYRGDPVLFAYGNSRGDRRLLLAATYPFDVGQLGPLGALRQFPRLASVTAGE